MGAEQCLPLWLAISLTPRSFCRENVSLLVNTHLLGAYIGFHQTLGPAHEVRMVTHQWGRKLRLTEVQ